MEKQAPVPYGSETSPHSRTFPFPCILQDGRHGMEEDQGPYQSLVTFFFKSTPRFFFDHSV
jgi:hypothetical protein